MARSTSGQLAVLACPPPLCPHVEFAVAAVLGVPVSLEWSPQPARPRSVCASVEWRGAARTAGRPASRLSGPSSVYFQVVEGATPGRGPPRDCGTPQLGLHRAPLAAHRGVVVPPEPVPA